MKEQAEAYKKGENLLTYGLKEWYLQIRTTSRQIFPDWARFDQLLSALLHLITKKNPPKMIGKALSTSLYQQYF